MEKIDELINLSQEDLEKREFAYKIRQHSIPWWKKPAFWIAIVPIIFAFGAFIELMFTNYFGRQRDLIKKEQLVLENENFILTRKQEELNKEQKKLELETEILIKQKKSLKAEKESLEKEKVSLDNDINKLNEVNRQLETEKLDLEQEKLIIKNDLEKIQLELKALQIRLKTEPIRVQLAALASTDNTEKNPQHAAVGELIKIIQTYISQNENLEDVVSLFNEHKNDQVLNGTLNYILFKATNDINWLNKILTIAEKEGNKLPQDFWLVFGTGQWDKQQIYVWEKLIPIMRDRNLSQESLSEILLDFIWIQDEESFLNFRKKDLFYEAVKIARNITLNTEIKYTLRTRGLDAIKQLCPDLTLVVMAKLVISSKTPSGLRYAIIEALEEAESDIRHDTKYDTYNPQTKKFGEDPLSDKFAQAYVQRDFPASNSASTEFTKWLNQNKDLEKIWLEKDLKQAISEKH